MSGELEFLNRISTGGGSACHVSLDEKNRLAFVSNYGSGSLSVISLNEDGSLNKSVQFLQNTGTSSDKRRQEGPHVHGAFITPDRSYLLSPDLGTDKVNIYKYDPSDKFQPLMPSEPSYVSVKPGNGPRLITFHPNSRIAYLIQEMGGVITVFDYNDGKLTEKQTVSILSPDFKGRVGASDILFSEDGRFLYATNRGDANEIVIYSVNKKDGRLEYAGRQTSMGKTPRSIAIDPTGKYLLAGNQESNEIIIFNRDKKTGMLTPTEKKIEIKRPVSLKFVNLK
jgi:6-phosphogluconolactonase